MHYMIYSLILNIDFVLDTFKQALKQLFEGKLLRTNFGIVLELVTFQVLREKWKS